MKDQGRTSRNLQQEAAVPAGTPPPGLPPALINPVRLPGEAGVPPRAVLAFTRPDAKLLAGLLQAGGEPFRRLWTCDLRQGSWQGREVLLAGPLLGAPQAAMVLEKLIVLGAKAVVGLGWCGSLQPEVPLGSLVLPECAFGGDGTSPHYAENRRCHRPHAGLHRLLAKNLQELTDKNNMVVRSGPVWTTDAVYRETAALVARGQGEGALAVEMEMAALFAVGAFRGVAVAGLLVVSDELFSLTWRSGARTPQYRQAREVAARLTLNTLAAWDDTDA